MSTPPRIEVLNVSLVYRDSLADRIMRVDDEGVVSFEEDTEGLEQEVDTIFFPGCALLNFVPELMFEVHETLKSIYTDQSSSTPNNVIPGLTRDPSADGISTDNGLPIESAMTAEEFARTTCGISVLCCGEILKYEPEGELVRATHERQLVESLLAHKVKRIITACPNCFRALRDCIEVALGSLEIEVLALPEVLHEAGLSITEEAIAQKVNQAVAETSQIQECPSVTIHDSCPDRALGYFAEGVRQLLPPNSVKEMKSNRKTSLCCGAPLRAMGDDDIADTMAQKRIAQAAATEAELIVTVCINCAQRLTWMSNGIEVCHYLELLYKHPIAWDALPPYMNQRYLFESHKGKREFEGLLSGPEECGNANE